MVSYKEMGAHRPKQWRQNKELSALILSILVVLALKPGVQPPSPSH